VVHEVLASARFPDHPLGREVLGEQDTIAAMTREQIAAFHAAHYRPANLVVAAAGQVDHDALVEGIAARCATGPGGASPRRQAPLGPPRPIVVVERPTEQAHVIVAVPAPPRDHEDRHAISVVDHVLGGGMSSRLFQSIREERGLAYSVYSYRSAFEGAGTLAVYAGTAPAQVGQVLELVHDGLDRVIAEGITAAELDAARSHLRGSMALGLEDSGARMSRIGHSQLAHGRVPNVEELDAQLSALSVEEVADVAKRWLGGDRTVAAVGPFGDQSVFERA
jgi:predicted Zn-dependent peptidase